MIIIVLVNANNGSISTLISYFTFDLPISGQRGGKSRNSVIQ